jgi:hypothetical protein
LGRPFFGYTGLGPVTRVRHFFFDISVLRLYYMMMSRRGQSRLLDLALFGVVKHPGRRTNGSASELSGLVSRQVVPFGTASLSSVNFIGVHL